MWDDESFEDTVLRPSLCLRYQDGTTLQDTAPQKGEEEAEEETDGEEEAREPSVYGTLSAGWGDAIVEVSALPADGTLFSLEGLSSVEVLGQSFAFS